MKEWSIFLAVLLAALIAVSGCSAPDARLSTTTASAAARPAPDSTPVPVGLEIPSIGVVTGSPLLPLGLDEHNRLEVPDAAEPEIGGWFARGVRPGDRGPAVIVAHVDGNGRPGLFSRLHELAPDAEIRVSRADGSMLIFRATRVAQYRKLDFPTESVWGDTPGAQLRLITCGGTFSERAGAHEDNVIVWADLAPPSIT